jgi:ketosteroid isomerase-like protein
MATLTMEQFTQQDQAAVRQLFDDCIRYVNAADWTSWAGIYAEDGFLQPPNAPVIRGRAELVAWGQAFPPIESFAFSNVQVWGEGNLAYGVSGYTLKVKDAPADTGKQLCVFRRGQDGRWKVVAASFSSDLPK